MRKLLIILCIIFFMTGCVQKNDEKVITFWTLQMGDFSDYINNIIQEYEISHPKIKINWIDVPFSEGEKRTLAAVMSDNPPDLINLNPDFSAILAQKGVLTEIEEAKLDDFNPEIINALKYDERIYSIPWYATSAITIYNKTLFEKLNQALPKTYNDLYKISETIKNKTGTYSYIPTISENDTMLKILNKYGISEINDLDSPKSEEIFNMFKDLYIKNLIPPESITMTHREALEQYMAGKIIFFQGGANFLNIIKENAPKIYHNTDITEQIKGSLGQNDFSLMNFVIPIKAKYKDESIDFCLFLTNEKNQLELAKKTNIIATNKKALSDNFYNDYSTIESKARSISAKQIAHINPALKQKKNQKEINIILNQTVQSVLLNKDTTSNLLKIMKRKCLEL